MPCSQVTEYDMDDVYFLGSVDSTGEEQLTVQLDIKGTIMESKIDTGADVNVMSKTSFKEISQKEELHRADKILKGPGAAS